MPPLKLFFVSLSVSVTTTVCWAFVAGMSVPYKQDLPPSGGFDAIKYRRNLPTKGPGGALVFASILAICSYGFYKVGQGNVERRELSRENAWARIHILPALLAENDRDSYRRQQAALSREKEIMKDVKGWEVGKSPYHSKRYTPSTIVVI